MISAPNATRVLKWSNGTANPDFFKAPFADMRSEFMARFRRLGEATSPDVELGDSADIRRGEGPAGTMAGRDISGGSP
jgi:hypothetical protein